MARQDGLSDEQVAGLRADLAAGSFPRVRFGDGQPGASTGTVRRVGDPATDGDDYVVVRVKINGVTDDLRFAPHELRRGSAPAKTPAKKTPVKKTAATKAPAKKASSAPAKSPARTPAKKTPAPKTPAKKAAPPAVTTSASKRKPSRRAGYGPPVTLTLHSSETSWTVTVQRGARTVVKTVPVNPGVVSAIAELLDIPAVAETVAGVNDIALADAESRAEILRAELEQIQAVLDTHRRP